MPTAVDLELCSLALLRIGCEPVASNILSRQGELCERIYPHEAEGLLASYPWTFATVEARLVPLGGVDTAGWQYAYEPPRDTLRIMGVKRESDAQLLDYARLDRYVLADVSPIILQRIRSVPSALFPPYFRVALVSRLAYALALPLTEHMAKAQMLYQFADAEAQSARKIDAQSKPPSALKSFPLTEVRG